MISLSLSLYLLFVFFHSVLCLDLIWVQSHYIGVVVALEEEREDNSLSCALPLSHSINTCGQYTAAAIFNSHSSRATFQSNALLLCTLSHTQNRARIHRYMRSYTHVNTQKHTRIREWNMFCLYECAWELCACVYVCVMQWTWRR